MREEEWLTWLQTTDQTEIAHTLWLAERNGAFTIDKRGFIWVGTAGIARVQVTE